MYLREARLREKPAQIDRKQIPNADIEVSNAFVQRNAQLLGSLMHAIAAAGLGTPGAVDFDVREALESLVRTYRTRESGLYYETRPSNLIAAGIMDRLQKSIEEFRKAAAEKAGLTTVRDADVLGMLAFFQRLEYQFNNGHKRGRAFLDYLQSQCTGLDLDLREPAASSSLIVP